MAALSSPTLSSCVPLSSPPTEACLRSAPPSFPSNRVPTSIRFPKPSSFPSSSKIRSPPPEAPTVLQPFIGFTGFAFQDPLPSVCIDLAFSGFGLSTINYGCEIYAMRHGKRVPKLNRPPDQRKALLRGLTTQLLKHGRIKTTKARARAMRKHVDKMITLAKDGSLHKKKQALGYIYEKPVVNALFEDVHDRYGERNGGYTRILKTLPRRGDNAPMAYIELV